MFKEHVNRDADASAVTMGMDGGRVRLRVGRAVLTQLPWFRGGVGVSVLLGQGAEAGRMLISRGDTLQLRTMVQQGGLRLEKLPPVQLVMEPLPGMSRGISARFQAVAHKVLPGLLEITLPPWAAPPVPATAPPTSFSQGFFVPAATSSVTGGAA